MKSHSSFAAGHTLYRIAGISVWRIVELKIKFGEWIDFGHKNTIYQLKFGWLKFGESQTTRQIRQTFPLYCDGIARKRYKRFI